MKKLIFLFSLCLPFAVFANCPLPHSLTYQCHELNGNRMCTWSPRNGWYQGSADLNPALSEGDHAPIRSFEKAIWFPYLDDQHGATLCYYRGPQNEKIVLFQQTGYGTVPPPKGSLWNPETGGEFPGGLECYADTVRCNFAFGERF